jgi:hypothetical protein
MRGATPKAVMEIDWYGNFGGGNNGPIHLIPRLRTAYAELNWGAHRLIFGQNYDLTAAMGPVSLAHIANPLTLGSGNAGFRRPGVFGYHTFGDLKNRDASKVEFSWEIGRSQWADLGAGGVAGGFTGVGSAVCNTQGPPGNGIPAVCAGEASGLPAIQARLAWTGGTKYSAYIGGHWNRVDRSGMGVADSSYPRGAFSTLDVLAGVAGAKGVFGPMTLAAAGYIGKNAAPLIASINGGSFTAGLGDVREMGGWAQAGWNFTKELSLWGLVTYAKANDADAVPGSGYTATRSNNYSGLLQYRDGGYAVGLEYTHFRTTYNVGTTAANVALGLNPGNVQEVNQLALTGIYYF